MAGRAGNLKRLSEWINLLNADKTAQRLRLIKEMDARDAELGLRGFDQPPASAVLPEYERSIRRNSKSYQDQFRNFDPLITEREGQFLNTWVDDSDEALGNFDSDRDFDMIGRMLDKHAVPVEDPVWRGGPTSSSSFLQKYSHVRPYSFSTDPGVAIEFAGVDGVGHGELIHARAPDAYPGAMRYFPVPNAGESELLSPYDSRFERGLPSEADEITRRLRELAMKGELPNKVFADSTIKTPMIRTKRDGGSV